MVCVAQQDVQGTLVTHRCLKNKTPFMAFATLCWSAELAVTSRARLNVAACAAGSGIRLVRGEVDKLDKRTTNVQGNVANVVSVLVWQHNAGCIPLSETWKGTINDSCRAQAMTELQCCGVCCSIHAVRVNSVL